MKKLGITAALAVLIVSCGSKNNKRIEMMADHENDSVFVVDENVWEELQVCNYEGTLPSADSEGIHYQLTLQKTNQDSLDTYTLTTTYLGSKGEYQTLTDNGTVITLPGIPDDSTAIVYQLVSATPEYEKIYFLANDDSTLTMIGKDFKKALSKLNYTLRQTH